jgi:hypothetical protein
MQFSSPSYFIPLWSKYSPLKYPTAYLKRYQKRKPSEQSIKWTDLAALQSFIYLFILCRSNLGWVSTHFGDTSNWGYSLHYKIVYVNPTCLNILTITVLVIGIYIIYKYILILKIIVPLLWCERNSLLERNRRAKRFKQILTPYMPSLPSKAVLLSLSRNFQL